MAHVVQVELLSAECPRGLPPRLLQAVSADPLAALPGEHRGPPEPRGTRKMHVEERSHGRGQGDDTGGARLRTAAMLSQQDHPGGNHD